MSLSNYPAGAEFSPFAPWNQKDEIFEGECPECRSENLFHCRSKIKTKVWNRIAMKYERKWAKREVTICRNCFNKFE
jgi:hypothetical protein